MKSFYQHIWKLHDEKSFSTQEEFLAVSSEGPVKSVVRGLGDGIWTMTFPSSGASPLFCAKQHTDSFLQSADNATITPADLLALLI